MAIDLVEVDGTFYSRKQTIKVQIWGLGASLGNTQPIGGVYTVVADFSEFDFAMTVKPTGQDPAPIIAIDGGAVSWLEQMGENGIVTAGFAEIEGTSIIRNTQFHGDIAMNIVNPPPPAAGVTELTVHAEAQSPAIAYETAMPPGTYAKSIDAGEIAVMFRPESGVPNDYVPRWLGGSVVAIQPNNDPEVLKSRTYTVFKEIEIEIDIINDRATTYTVQYDDNGSIEADIVRSRITGI